MDNLAVLYFYGKGVAQDYQQVRLWCEKAADKDDAVAIYNLGYLYDFSVEMTVLGTLFERFSCPVVGRSSCGADKNLHAYSAPLEYRSNLLRISAALDRS